MKRAWLLLIMVSIVGAPVLSRAGTTPTYQFWGPLVKLSENELARTTGQGCNLKAGLQNQEGRVVIWDEWALGNRLSGKARNVSLVGQASIDYRQRQATFSAPR